MKLDTFQPEQPPIRLEQIKKQDKEITLLNVERKQKGLNLFEYNKITGEITAAEYIPNDTFTIGSDGENKVNVKPGCIYVQATNKKNALRKAKEIVAGTRKPKAHKNWEFPFQ